MNYVEMHIGDYSAATFHLTPLEDGIYWRLLRCYYRDERPLPPDLADVERMAGARTPEERQAVAAILREFFTEEEQGFRHSRCDAEITHYLAKSKKASASASARWAGRRGRNANAMPTDSDSNAPQAPSPKHQENPPTPRKRGSVAERFEEFWQAWPKSERKQDKAKCAEHWRRHQLDEFADVVLADVRTKRATEKWRDGYIEAPLVYLRGRRWEDGVTPNDRAPGEPLDWRESAAGIKRRGDELGVAPWDEAGGEHWPTFKARVMRAHKEAEDGPVDPAGAAKLADLLGGVVKKVA